MQPESYARLAADPNVSDPLIASDFYVAQYADNYFEYDSQRRVTKEIVEAGSRTFTFSYSQSAFEDGSNAWKYKTVETLPDAEQNIETNNQTPDKLPCKSAQDGVAAENSIHSLAIRRPAQ